MSYQIQSIANISIFDIMSVLKKFQILEDFGLYIMHFQLMFIAD